VIDLIVHRYCDIFHINTLSVEAIAVKAGMLLVAPCSAMWSHIWLPYVHHDQDHLVPRR
jgi:hypothetical protein